MRFRGPTWGWRQIAMCSGLLFVTSCGWSERRFEVVGIERLCERAAKCAGTYDAATCVDRLRTADRSSCTYDGAAAADCASQVEEAACKETEPFGLSELEIPEPCVETYDC